MMFRLSFPRRRALAVACGMAAVALPFASPTLAQPAATTATRSLSEAVVTANRIPMRADELVGDVVVINRAAIEASAGRTLPELLALRGGLQFSANGGRGKISNVFIRGTEARHTLLLIDGVRYGSASAGTPIWETLPLDAIERIEILKGPASSLYGSDAVGGVVQIFTRKGRAGFHPRAFVSVGSRSLVEAGAGLSAGQGAWTYAVDVKALHDKGFSATNAGVPFGSFNPDRDGFEQQSVNATLGWQLAPDWKLDAGALYSDGKSRFDDGPGVDARSAVRAQLLRMGLDGKPLPGWRTQLRLAQSADTANALMSSFMPSDFKTTQDQLLWQNDVDTPLGVALFGLERLEQRVAGSTDYDVKQRTVSSVFGGLSGSTGPHSWQFNLRRDRNTQFGNADTGFAGYGFRIAPAWRVSASYGTSFVAPSFNQLYFPGFGSPTLRPERGRNKELALTWSEGSHSVKLVYFDNRIRGFIPSGPFPANVPRARIDGWTLGYEGSVGTVALRASLESVDPRNELTGKKLPRRNSNQLVLGADYGTGPWTFGGTLLKTGARFDDGANSTRLDGFTTLDLNAAYALNADWRLQTSLTNLGDEKYETVKGYNQPRRAVVVTLRWEPRK